MTGHDDDFDPAVLDLLSRGMSTTPPSSALRGRLFARIGGRDRFLPFLDRLISLFDLPEDDTRREIDAVMDPQAEWESLAPGCTFRDFDGGPALGEAHAGLVRVAPGSSFPSHRHIGEERTLVLQGRVADEHGNEYRAGDLIVMADGTEHELRAVGDQEVVYASVVIALDFPEGDA
jgi:quercetin dioxygenase-like cupin family protein